MLIAGAAEARDQIRVVGFSPFTVYPLPTTGVAEQLGNDRRRGKTPVVESTGAPVVA